MGNSQDSTPNPAAAPLEADLPGFNPSKRNRLDPLDPEQTTVTVTDPPASSPNPQTETMIRQGVYDDPRAEVDELDEEEPFGLPDPKNLSSSSRGSTREPDPVIADAAGQLAKLGVTLASLGLNRTIGRGNGAWVIHDDEANAIAEPLGRIAARHAPIGDGAAGDVADGIDAGLAAAGYAMRATADHHLAHTVPAPEAPGGDAQ